MFFAGLLVGVGGLALIAFLYGKHEEKKTKQALQQVTEIAEAKADENEVTENEEKEVE